jgi:hypothetical protein
MPLKWKIFRLANYLLLLLSLSFTVIVTYFFFSNNSISATEFFYFFLFAASGLVLITNYGINIFLLERYYPDHELPGGFTMFMAIILSLSSVTIAFLTLVYVVEIYNVFGSLYSRERLVTRAVLVGGAFGMILLISYYVFWMQVVLRRTIQRNRQKLYTAFLDAE